MEPRIGPERDPARARISVRIRMTARAVDEPHRASTRLELLFDLTFVVAIAAVVVQLGHGVEVVGPFLQVFFAIWWAWMNFTWFASSYDTDDVPYRLLTLLQMSGVLVLAAGVPSAFGAGDYRAVTLGYLLMRVGLVVLWLRAAREDPEGRGTALRYAAGISAVEVLWLVRLLVAELGVLSGTALVVMFLALVVAELAVPVWAERSRGTSWHPHHIAERYSLFTIILLGESVLAVSTGIADALGTGLHGSLVVVAGSGLVLLFALWWLYDLEPSADPSPRWVRASRSPSGRPEPTMGTTRWTRSARAMRWRPRPRRSWCCCGCPIAPRSPVRPSILFGPAALVLLAPVAGAGAGTGAIVTLVALVAAAAVVVTVVRSHAGAGRAASR
jgi:low temperature requirement A protein (LtrA)